MKMVYDSLLNHLSASVVSLFSGVLEVNASS